MLSAVFAIAFAVELSCSGFCNTVRDDDDNDAAVALAFIGEL